MIVNYVVFCVVIVSWVSRRYGRHSSMHLWASVLCHIRYFGVRADRLYWSIGVERMDDWRKNNVERFGCLSVTDYNV